MTSSFKTDKPMKYLICHAYFSGIVQIIPTGPLYIAINTRENVKCSVTGGTFIVWTVIFTNSTQQLRNDIPGINIASKNKNSSSLVVNTTDTSIIGLRCICFDALPDDNGLLEQITGRINLTIYGMLMKFLRG